MLIKMKKLAVILLIIIVAFSMVSCSGDKEAAEEPKDVATQTETSAQDSKTPPVTVNTSETAGKSASIPQGYPADLFPIYEGSFVANAMETGGSYTIIAFSKKDYKEIAAYYQEVLKDAKVLTESNVENGFTSFGTLGAYTYNFDAGSSTEQEGYVTSITIILMPAAK